MNLNFVSKSDMDQDCKEYARLYFYVNTKHKRMFQEKAGWYEPVFSMCSAPLQQHGK
jgi:hypothetical protein